MCVCVCVFVCWFFFPFFKFKKKFLNFFVFFSKFFLKKNQKNSEKIPLFFYKIIIFIMCYSTAFSPFITSLLRSDLFTTKVSSMLHKWATNYQSTNDNSMKHTTKESILRMISYRWVFKLGQREMVKFCISISQKDRT